MAVIRACRAAGRRERAVPGCALAASCRSAIPVDSGVGECFTRLIYLGLISGARRKFRKSVSSDTNRQKMTHESRQEQGFALHPPRPGAFGLPILSYG